MGVSKACLDLEREWIFLKSWLFFFLLQFWIERPVKRKCNIFCFSQKVSHCCHGDSSCVCLIDDSPFSSFKRLSRFSCYISTCSLSSRWSMVWCTLALCPHVVSQASQHFRSSRTQSTQHFRSSRTQSTLDSCFDRKSVCLVISFYSSISRVNWFMWLNM